MPASESRIRVKRTDGHIQIEFVDRNILDEGNVRSISDEIAAIIEAEPKPRMVISFANVEHLSSAALGALITLNNRIRARSGQLRLSNINPQIYEVFAITRLHTILQIHPTNEDAAKSFV